MNPIYYESHVTVEPCFGDELKTFNQISGQFGFRVADLFLQKDRTVTPERSNKDSFCTGKDKNYEDLKLRMDCLVTKLEKYNIQVWRAKIEAILYDERFK